MFIITLEILSNTDLDLKFILFHLIKLKLFKQPNFGNLKNFLQKQSLLPLI